MCFLYICAWTVLHCLSLTLVEHVSCFKLDGHCRFTVVDGMCCHRLVVYCGASGTMVDIQLGKGK
jgi:hypothetical protein